MQKNNTKAGYLTSAGIIAALYVVLTMISTMMGLSSGAVQVRLSEALCVLPCFTSAAVPGLFVGCLISNLLSGCVIWDVVFGSLATLIGAVGTRFLRKKRILATASPIIVNAAVIPVVLIYAYGVENGYLMILLTVTAGELISCGLLGSVVYNAVNKALFASKKRK